MARGAFTRTVVVRFILGLAIVSLYVLLGRSLPGITGILALAIPAVMLLRCAMRALPASRWAMLVTGGAVVFSTIVHTGLLGSEINVMVVLAAMAGGGLGLVLGLVVRPKSANAGPVLPGLAFPLIAWQLSVLLTQAIAMTGLVNVVRLLAIAQGFFAGVAGTACLAALVPLTFRRRAIAPVATPIILRRVSIVLLFVLAAMTIGQPGRTATEGVYEGVLDPEILSQRKAFNTECGFLLKVTASPVRIRIFADGSAELVNDVTCRIVWNHNSSRDVFEHTIRPAGRDGPGQLLVDHDEVHTHFEPRGICNPTDRTIVDPHSIQADRCLVQDQPDGTVWVKMRIGYTEMIRDIPWRCEFIGATSASAPVSPGGSFETGEAERSLTQIVSDLGRQGDLGDEAAKAGLIAGLLALLAGASLDLAGLLAGAAAGAANISPPPQVRTPGARVLSGDDARQWLKRNGFVDGAGRFTDAYTQWTNRLYDEEASSPLQLVQYYGHRESAGPGRNDRFLPPDADVDIMIMGGSGPAPVEPPPAPAPQKPTPPRVPVVEPVMPLPQVKKEPLPPKEPDPPKTPPDPCIAEVQRLAQIQNTGEALIREMRQLKGQMDAVRAEIRATDVSGRFSFAVDLASSGFTMLATSMGGPMASLSVSLVQNLAADSVKTVFHKIYREDPANFIENLFTSETVASISTLFGNRLKKKMIEAGIDLSTNPGFLAELNQKFRLNAGGILQLAYTASSGTANFTRSKMQLAQLVERLKNLAALRKKTHAFVEAERITRDTARVELNACRARQAAAGGSEP